VGTHPARTSRCGPVGSAVPTRVFK
jgi:hypothetical protein